MTSDHAYIYHNGHVTPAFQSRFSVETTDAGDDYTLVIADVRLNDSAFYLCIEDAGLGNRHFSHLNVTGKLYSMAQLSLALCKWLVVTHVQRL